MLQAHFDHDYGEVYAIVMQEISELGEREARDVTDVVHSYGASHRNGATYLDFKAVVRVALPATVREKQLRPVFKRLFDYTPNGEKRDKRKAHTVKRHPSTSNLLTRTRD
jgi:hypothetical protein